MERKEASWRGGKARSGWKEQHLCSSRKLGRREAPEHGRGAKGAPRCRGLASHHWDAGITQGAVRALKTNFPLVDSIIIVHSTVGPTLSIWAGTWSIERLTVHKGLPFQITLPLTPKRPGAWIRKCTRPLRYGSLPWDKLPCGLHYQKELFFC